jgi:hypothetical protein
MADARPITLTLQLERDERDSICVRLPGSEGAAVFLPISQIEIAPERHGRKILVTMPRWLAETKGLTTRPDPNQGVLL